MLAGEESVFLDDLHQSCFLGETEKDGRFQTSRRLIMVVHYECHFLLVPNPCSCCMRQLPSAVAQQNSWPENAAYAYVRAHGTC